MKTALLLALVLLPACQAQEGVTWITDYEQARRVSRETGKPILVQFRCEA